MIKCSWSIYLRQAQGGPKSEHKELILQGTLHSNMMHGGQEGSVSLRGRVKKDPQSRILMKGFER